MRGNLSRARRNERRDIVAAPLSGAKTMLIGDRRCTLGVYCMRSGVWAPSVSIDPAQAGAERQMLTSTPDQLRPTAGEAMAEAQRMAERYMNPTTHDPVMAQAFALLGTDAGGRRIAS